MDARGFIGTCRASPQISLASCNPITLQWFSGWWEDQDNHKTSNNFGNVQTCTKNTQFLARTTVGLSICISYFVYIYIYTHYLYIYCIVQTLCYTYIYTYIYMYIHNYVCPYDTVDRNNAIGRCLIQF